MDFSTQNAVNKTTTNVDNLASSTLISNTEDYKQTKTKAETTIVTP